MKAEILQDQVAPRPPAAVREPARGGIFGRGFEIGWRIAGFLAWHLLRTLGLRRAPTPARRFAMLLEDLGTSFVKLGQHLSLRTDLFPPDYLEELQKLQDDVRPFPLAEAVRAIERAFGKPPSQIFIRFDEEPLAAASVAQVHSARTFSGHEVVVKILRPHVAAQVDRDMLLLTALVRFLAHFSPLLTRYKAVEVVREVSTSLRKELDLREEARNVRRFADAFRGSETIDIPDVVMDLCVDTVLVQERSHGRRVGDPANQRHGAELAQHLIDAYVKMLFELGYFHGDPHPGNVFIREDGRIALHDFGVVGSLDRPTRHALAAFMLAFTEQDTEWLLDSWLELGMLSKSAQREVLRPTVGALMNDYSRRPIAEWSIGEAFARLVSATRGHDFDVPLHLLVLGRTIVLLESVVRTLDPGFSLLDSFSARSREVMSAALGAEQRETRRLQYETAVASVEWQRLLAASMRKFREEGLRFQVDHEGLPELSEQIVKGASRVALALVTLGLYMAASLLMQYESGPSLFGFPLLPGAFYVVALFFTLRLIRAIGRSL